MEVPRIWRNRHTRYALIGSACEGCGAKWFPPADVCRSCGEPRLAPYRFRGQGEVYSYSTVRQAPNGFAGRVPYVVALVKLEEGPLVATQLADVDPEEVGIGMAVEMVTRRVREDGPDGVVVYGYKFRPPVPRIAQDASEPARNLHAALLTSRPPSGLPMT
jgi:uncharacterized OB-fold protein